MSLDDKLREIPIRIKGPKQDVYIALSDNEIAQIKQAFADEGYIKFEPSLSTSSPQMTGQEWYDRFVEFIKDHGFYENVTKDFVLKAAKKASGL